MNPDTVKLPRRLLTTVTKRTNLSNQQPPILEQIDLLTSTTIPTVTTTITTPTISTQTPSESLSNVQLSKTPTLLPPSTIDEEPLPPPYSSTNLPSAEESIENAQNLQDEIQAELRDLPSLPSNSSHQDQYARREEYIEEEDENDELSPLTSLIRPNDKRYIINESLHKNQRKHFYETDPISLPLYLRLLLLSPAILALTALIGTVLLLKVFPEFFSIFHIFQFNSNHFSSSHSHSYSTLSYTDLEIPYVHYHHPLTITSAYYPTSNAKHTTDEYKLWLTKFFGLMNTPLFIFTNRDFFLTLAVIRYSNLFEGLNTDHIQLLLNTYTNDQLSTHAASYLSLLLPHKSTKHYTTHYLSYWYLNFSSPTDIPIISQYKTKWSTTQYNLDPEKDKHSAFLYQVWNAKAYYLKISTEINPFISKYFMWYDAGSVRSWELEFEKFPNYRQIGNVFEPDTIQNYKTLPDYPHAVVSPTITEIIANPAKFTAKFAVFNVTLNLHPAQLNARVIHNPQHKMLVSMVGSADSAYCEKNSTGGFTGNWKKLYGWSLLNDKRVGPRDLIGGTYFIGTTRAIQWYSDLYYKMMTKYMKKNWFAGKDQLLMNDMVTFFPQSFLLLKTKKQNCRWWWFFLPTFFAVGDLKKDCPPEVFEVENMVVPATDLCKDPSYIY